MAATSGSTLSLSPRQRKALEDICEAFCPSGEGLASARELGVPDAIEQAIAQNPRASERRQFAALLGAWNSPALGPLGGVGLKSFAALPVPERERALLAWGQSRLPQRRAVFHALRKGALLFYYMLPGPEGARNPAWDAIGYDGPLGKLPDAPPKALRTTEPDAGGRLECDVVIIGSGAGGGAAAGVLAGAGLDVIVVEAGDYYDDEDFEGSELGAITRFYMGSPAATHDQSVGLVAGACLGGGTVVNYTTSFRTPDDVREEWAAHGVPAFTSEDYTASLDAVCDRLGVNQEHNDPSTREQKLRDGCTALGWHIDAMPRGVRRCAQGKECGYCGLGCRVGAKQSVVKTWLADAQESGTRVVVRTKVDRVLVEGGAARGIAGRTADGRPLTIRARAVIVACGALHTPALLRRSGLQNPNIGKHLRLHPAAAVFGVFDEELKPWEGVMQALYSDQHRDLHGGYGLKYETAANHPHLFIPFSPWRGGADHYRLMQALSHTVPIGVLLRDRDGGEVRVGRDGEPVARYKLSPFDTGHLRTGIDGAAQILEAAGARRVFSSHTKWVGYDPAAGNGPTGGADGTGRARFMADADAAGYGAGQISLGSFHIMGSARMGGSPATSACDPTGQTWDVRDLYVMDGSSFPTASGVNPQISIQSIAHMNARGLAARLR
jgi:choline dehydrogenase-like flavoprotein